MTDDFMNLPLDEEFDTMMDVQQNPHGAWQAIQTLTDQIEGLKKELNICRMAQVVMENGIAEAEKERDEALNQWDSARHSVDVLEKRVAFVEEERRKTFQALLKVTKIHDEVEAKLATCEKYRDAYAECDRIGTQAVRDLEDKLEKAMRALERAKASIESGGGGGVTDVVWLDDPCPETLCDFIDATLAEIEGDRE